MQVYYTDDVASKFHSFLVYGNAGAGKTPLAATAPNPLIVTSEPGLKSLQSTHLPYVLGRDYAESLEVLKWIKGSNETKKFETIFSDSISALSENIMAAQKKRSNDPRKFSPETTAQTIEIVLGYLNITNKNIVMTCKATENVDQITGAKTHEPFAVVPKLGPQLPYHFDNVLYLSRHSDPATGQETVWFRCRENADCIARNRTGRLGLWEPADISRAIAKLNGVI